MDIFADRYDKTGRGIARSLIPALFLLGAVSPAQAQQDTSAQATQESKADDNTIIVEGMSKSELKKTISGYVRTLTEMDEDMPLARYQPGLYCPVVLGLDDANNKLIAKRMLRVAKAAGVKPAKEGCTASAFVFLVDDKNTFLKEFKKLQPIFFQDPKGDLWSPPSEKGPVTSWQLTQQFDPDGKPVATENETGIHIISNVSGGSRLQSMISLAVAASVVVIERKALAGLTTMQIADYALMRSLTDSGPKDLKDAEQFSILGVINTPMGQEANASLTAWDFAYIEGRYKNDARTYAQKQRATIRDNVEQAVVAKNEG